MMNQQQDDAILDGKDTTPLFSLVCTKCRHSFQDGSRACVAFPGGIPMKIWLGKHQHTTPLRGDHSIQFEKLATQDLQKLSDPIADALFASTLA